MAALLISETGNIAKVVKYSNECKEMGIRVQPPDVNLSDWNFTPDLSDTGQAGIRFGLGAVKNLGHSAVDAILAARAEAGRFRSIYHFGETVDRGALNRRMIESLIKAGAMDSLGGARSRVFAAVESAIEHGQKVWRDRQNGQAGLFGDLPMEQMEDKPLPNVPEWTVAEKLTGEKEVLGFYVTGHPPEQFEDKVKELVTHDTSSLEGLERGVDVVLCGILTGVQRKRNREGRLWASMHLEDRQGTIEVVVFTTNFESVQDQLAEDRAVMVKGSVLPEENAPPKISVLDVVPLELARVALPSLISIRVWARTAHRSRTGRRNWPRCSKASRATPGSGCDWRSRGTFP